MEYITTTLGNLVHQTAFFSLTWGNVINFVFLLCAIFLFADAIWFISNQRFLGNAGKKPFKNDQRQFVSKGKKEAEENKPLTSGDKKRIAAIILVTLFSVVFWIDPWPLPSR